MPLALRHGPYPGAVPERALTIGLVVDDGLDAPDGVQQYVLTVARHLAARGHDVHLVASTTRRTDLERLHVLGRHLRVRFNGNTLGSPLPARAADIRRLLDEVPFDVLHVQLPNSPFLSGRLVRRAPARVAVVGTFHILPESPVVAVGTRGLGILERRTLARFDEVMAVSPPASDFARASFGVASTVVPNPIDLDRFPTPPAREHDERPLRLVFLGRLVARKGPRELVDALAYLVDHRLTSRPWTLTLAGTGPLADDLRRRVELAGLEDRVELSGFVAEDGKAALLADADLVVLPSTGGESFGISVIEAMAAGGGPVLAGDNPGYRSTLDGLEDQLVDSRDRAAFGRALARWIDDDAARATATARQRAAVHRFDADLVVDQIEATYRRALARRH